MDAARIGATLPAKTRVPSLSATSFRNVDPSLSAIPPPSTTSSISIKLMTEANAADSASAAWSIRRNAS